ncbi:oxidoreductase, partial [[Clostridium] symbiosum]|nr:oxidoreductase [[Clostridium] symbiosum]
YFDFYLFHNVYEKNIDPYMDEENGIMEYLLKQKTAGRIKHLGFSAHGRYDTIKRFLEAYSDELEFCQIQLNYLD